MDISDTLIGKSEQLDNIDLMAGPRDFTITGVTRGSVEQPINITLAEYDRPWRPGLTMRRLLAAVWGPDASVYVGRRVRLYRDPDVTFGPDKPGGTRLSHASHIEKVVTVALPSKRGKVAAFTVQPLTDAPVAAHKPASATAPTLAMVDECVDEAQLRLWWKAAPALQPQIEARVKELQAHAASDPARETQGELG